MSATTTSSATLTSPEGSESALGEAELPTGGDDQTVAVRPFKSPVASCCTYGRGVGLVDTPRPRNIPVFPPVFPRYSTARDLSLHGDHRGAHRGFIGMSMYPDGPLLGGDHHGA